MSHNFVGNNDIGETGLFALRHVNFGLFVAHIETLVVVSFNHAFGALFEMFKLLLSVKDVLHLNYYTNKLS